MNGPVPPFENGLEPEARHRLRAATVVDIHYEEHTATPGGGVRVIARGAAKPPAAVTMGSGPGRVTPRVGSKYQVPVEWDEESDTQVMGPRHLIPTATAAGLELEWDNDDSNTEKWSPRHATSARGVEAHPKPARAVPPAPPPRFRAPEDAIEELREQLIEVLERARISEARAAAAERDAREADKARAALATLRNQFTLTIERARNSEAERAAIERRAQAERTASERRAREDEQETQAALLRLSEQLAEALERADAFAAYVSEAERRSTLAEQAAQNARAERQQVEDTLTRAVRRASSRSVIMFMLSVALLAGCAAAGYFAIYAPLLQRTAAQEAQRGLDAAGHTREIAALQARHDAERQQFEAERRQLEAQLPAARPGGATAATAARTDDASELKARAPRWHRAKTTPATQQEPGAQPSQARPNQARPNAARPNAAQPTAAQPTPASSRESAPAQAPTPAPSQHDDRENDPLEGL
jgi:hypothetical protein